MTHRPNEHLFGLLYGQPLAELHNALDVVHKPSSHRYGIDTGHVRSIHVAADATHEPSRQRVQVLGHDADVAIELFDGHCSKVPAHEPSVHFTGTSTPHTTCAD